MRLEVVRRLISIFILLLFIETVQAQCITVNDITSYKEDFEANNGNWKSGGSVSDWAWGSPTKPTIGSAGSGQKCWITGGLTRSFYNNSERSYLVSPCFDFTNLINPFISFKIFWETEYIYDGASFQYSLDNGATWQNVGGVNEAASCLNANWFNYANIKNLNGLGPNNEGWSGTIQPSGGQCGGGNGSGAWLLASHTMNNLAGKPSVMFRFTFGAGYVCNNYDGVAIDDITVSTAPPGTADFVSACLTNLQLSFTNNSGPCFNSYSWNFGDPASGAANITTSTNPSHIFSAAGSYNVTLIASGISGPVVVKKQIHVIDVKAAVTKQVTCSNNNGAISAVINADALITNIAYSWNTTPLSQNPNVTGLAAGTYIVTVTAANACAAKDTVTILGQLPLTHSVSKTDASCGLSNGAITISESGGIPPYKYAWQPNVSGLSSASNLSPNTYTITVTDNAGCIDVVTATINQLSQPLTHSVITTNISCTIPSGSAIIKESGGSSPYTYLWSPFVSSTNAAAGLNEGNYIINIHDRGICTDTVHVQIINTSTNKVSISKVTAATCFGNSDGAAMATATGIAPVTYTWSPAGGNASTAINLAAGQYTVTATDATGCAAVAKTQITQPIPFNITISTSAGCENNRAKAWATVTNGNMPYKYLWSDGSSNDTAVNLSSGSVSVAVTDAKGCSQSAQGIIKPFVPLKISLGNDTMVCPGNSVKLSPGIFAKYLWQDNTTVPAYIAMQTGIYSVQVTDSNGCIAGASVKVTALCQDILFPNAFTPGGDGRNDAFGPLGTLSAVSGYSLKIFNRFGQIVFTSASPYKKWNGTISGADSDNDVYVWIAQYIFNGGQRKVVKGSVLLLR